MSTEPGEKGRRWCTETQRQVLNPCCLKGNIWQNVTEKQHLLFISAFGLGQICWLSCGLNLKVLCQLPACVLSSPLPTAPCSALYFRELRFPGSPARSWDSLVRSIHLRWSPELGKHSWLSSCSPPCLLHGSNNCQTHPSFTWWS